MCCATKSLLVRSWTDAQFAVAVCARTERVDLHRLASQVGWKKARLASLAEIVELFGGFDIISPMAHAALPVIIDAPLMQFETVRVSDWPRCADVEIDPHELQTRTHAIAAPIALPRARWE
jgi:prolyl-tRNA editing enzyme YbaK/EbsC (Cys-tRNA(Pro) deacylase)